MTVGSSWLILYIPERWTNAMIIDAGILPTNRYRSTIKKFQSHHRSIRSDTYSMSHKRVTANNHSDLLFLPGLNQTDHSFQEYDSVTWSSYHHRSHHQFRAQMKTILL